MFSTRIRADSSFSCCKNANARSASISNGDALCNYRESRERTSISWAIDRLCCLAIAESFACVIRSRAMASLSCTFSRFCHGG